MSTLTATVSPAQIREALVRARARFARTRCPLKSALMHGSGGLFPVYRACERALQTTLPSAWTSLHDYAEWAGREDVRKRFDLAIASLEGGQP